MDYITEKFGYGTPEPGFTLHRRNENIAYCNRNLRVISAEEQADWWKLGATFKNICPKCLSTYSKEEINKIKHEFIVRKLKGL